MSDIPNGYVSGMADIGDGQMVCKKIYEGQIIKVFIRKNFLYYTVLINGKEFNYIHQTRDTPESYSIRQDRMLTQVRTDQRKKNHEISEVE